MVFRWRREGREEPPASGDPSESGPIEEEDLVPAETGGEGDSTVDERDAEFFEAEEGADDGLSEPELEADNPDAGQAPAGEGKAAHPDILTELRDVLAAANQASQDAEQARAELAENERMLTAARENQEEWRAAVERIEAETKQTIAAKEAELEEAQEARRAVEQELAENEEMFSTARENVTEWKEAVERVQAQAKETIARRDAEAEEAIERLSAELAQERHTRQSAEQELAENERMLSAARENMEEWKEAVERVQVQAREAIAEREAELAQAQEEVARVREEVEQQRTEREREAIGGAERAKSDAEGARAEVERLTGELAAERETRALAEQALAENERLLTSAQAQAKEAIAERKAETVRAAGEVQRLTAALEGGTRVGPVAGAGDQSELGRELRLAELRLEALRSDFDAVVQRGAEAEEMLARGPSKRTRGGRRSGS
jgi:chromosome segregation ATPase